MITHHYLVTNLSESVSAKDIFKIYEKRGAMENLIKESKYGFNFGKTDNHRFVENAVRIMISFIAYNIIELMKLMVIPESEKKSCMSTLRNKLIKIGAKVVSHSRKILINISSYYAYRDIFLEINKNIEQLT